MKNKCTVIQINGFRGILIVGFIILCAVAGFIIFPAWCCQHAWNFVASFITDMPLMELKHGAILWLIIALVSYVTLFGRFKISCINPLDAEMKNRPNMSDEEIFEAIEKKIREKKAEIENFDKEELKK